MPSSGPNEPKKGSGYFASRLKEKGVEQQKTPKEPTIQVDVETPKYGQIFEESSKSIASMAGDMNETAKLVSSMKEGLERVSKAVNLIDVGNPLCDPFGSCSYNGVDFAAKSTNSEGPTLDELDASADGSEESIELADGNEGKENEGEVSEYTTGISDLKFDADSIKDELQEFKDNMRQKETELVEFRTKLNNARLYAKEFANTDFSDIEPHNVTNQFNNQQMQNTEFDTIISDQSVNIDSIQDEQGSSRLAEIQQEIKENERRLFEARWKTKKAESEYEEKRAAKEELEDVRLSVSVLKAEKEMLATSLEELRSKIKKSEAEYEEKRAAKEELGEFNAALTHLKLEKELLSTELSDLKIRIKKAESEYEDKKAANESLAEVREILAYLKPERDSLKSELGHLRNKIERLDESYNEINSKKREIQMEYDDLRYRFKKAESEYEDKKNSFRLH